jgi:hypothetical protein
MGKKVILAVTLVLLFFSFAWAANSATIQMSCTIPSIPGVNAPARIAESSLQDYQRTDVTNQNPDSISKEEVIEKQEKKETTLPQGEKITTEIKTVYTR